MNSMQRNTNFFRLIAAAAAVAVLAACSSGGAPTTENPVVVAPEVPDYIGPAAANADVQAFRINLWENIKANNRCGSCHNAGGQTPQFARNDDVNLAYQAANSVVNLTQPNQSRMVLKVAGGHNCWLQSPAACGDTLTVLPLLQQPVLWLDPAGGANETRTVGVAFRTDPALIGARSLACRALLLDADAAAKVRYGHKVPVLLFGGELVCHGHLDASEVHKALACHRRPV